MSVNGSVVAKTAGFSLLCRFFDDFCGVLIVDFMFEDQHNLYDLYFIKFLLTLEALLHI